MEKKICPACGGENGEGAKFCTACGAAMAEVQGRPCTEEGNRLGTMFLERSGQKTKKTLSTLRFLWLIPMLLLIWAMRFLLHVPAVVFGLTAVLIALRLVFRIVEAHRETSEMKWFASQEFDFGKAIRDVMKSDYTDAGVAQGVANSRGCVYFAEYIRYAQLPGDLAKKRARKSIVCLLDCLLPLLLLGSFMVMHAAYMDIESGFSAEPALDWMHGFWTYLIGIVVIEVADFVIERCGKGAEIRRREEWQKNYFKEDYEEFVSLRSLPGVLAEDYEDVV